MMRAGHRAWSVAACPVAGVEDLLHLDVGHDVAPVERPRLPDFTVENAVDCTRVERESTRYTAPYRAGNARQRIVARDAGGPFRKGTNLLR